MIARSRYGGDVAVESRALFTDAATRPPARSDALVGRLHPRDVVGIPAFGRAVRLRSEAVASMRLRVWDSDDRAARQRKDGTWQARLFRGAPNDRQTRYAFWEATEESLAVRGNAFWWKAVDPTTRAVVELWALHPDQVQIRAVRGGVEYDVQVQDGYVDPVGRGQGVYRAAPVLHIRGHGDGGTLWAPSPVERFRYALAAASSRLRHNATTYANGAAVRLAVELPQTMTPANAREWRELWQETYGQGGYSTAVIGGGGTIKPIGMTLEDAQFVEAEQMSLRDCARIVGVPASVVDALDQAVPLEQERERWLRFDLDPGLMRIESALHADPDLFAGNLRLFPGFVTDGFVRGDRATESARLVQLVQSGVLLPDEARAELGRDPLPDGVGQIPQVVPVGGTPNPEQIAPAPAPGDTVVEATASGGRVERARADAGGGVYVTVENHLPPAVVDVAAPSVTVEAAAAPVVEVAAPSVTVEAPVVEVAAPNVTVEAPVVNVAAAEPAREVKVVTFRRERPGGPIVGADVVELEGE